jgi:hypothetical protein
LPAKGTPMAMSTNRDIETDLELKEKILEIVKYNQRTISQSAMGLLCFP